MTRVRALAFVCAALVSSVSCSKTDTATTPSSPTATSFTQVFAGTLSPGGTQTYAFSLAGGAPVRLTLGSLTDSADAPLSKTLRLTFGVPSGTGCGSLQSTTTAAGLSTHLSSFASAGTYCTSVTDAGQLTADSNFAVRITIGDFSSTPGAGIVTYSSALLPGGSTTRTFSASAAGDVFLLFDTLDPASIPSVTLGIGFPRSDGGGCQVNRSFVATRGSQFGVPVAAGTYCVKVSDPGTLTGAAQFSLRIAHP